MEGNPVAAAEFTEPDDVLTPAPPRAVDLFSGAGGFSLGLVEAGFEVIAAVDNWDPAVRSYAQSFDHPIHQADLASLSASGLRALLNVQLEEVDLVVGGPPCQGFSIQRIGADQDSRNDLVLAYAAHIKALRPRVFLMENVPGLLGKRGLTLAREFCADLEKAGYGVRSQRINMAEYGVPQVRRRVLIYGWRKDSEAPPEIPRGELASEEFRSVWSAIGDLPSPPQDHSPALSDPLHRRMRLSDLNRERLALIPPGGGFENLPLELRVNCHKDGSEKIGHRYVYGRLDASKPAGTITARFDSFTRGKFAHPFEDRNITLREGARLQTFPDQHSFLGTQEEVAALIGNAVPPAFSCRLADALRAHLEGGLDAEAAQPSRDDRLLALQAT